MVDKYSASVQVSVDSNGVETVSGNVEVIMDVPIEVTGYGGSEVTDEDIESAAIEAIQEGKARVIDVRPTVRQEPEEER